LNRTLPMGLRGLSKVETYQKHKRTRISMTLQQKLDITNAKG